MLITTYCEAQKTGQRGEGPPNLIFDHFNCSRWVRTTLQFLVASVVKMKQNHELGAHVLWPQSASVCPCTCPKMCIFVHYLCKILKGAHTCIEFYYSVTSSQCARTIMLIIGSGLQLWPHLGYRASSIAVYFLLNH